MSDLIECAAGCCPGCGDCFGYSLGCHQTPCRCDRPCTCWWDDESAGYDRIGCERHDAKGDTRRTDDPS